ncbi:hypothetical protein FRC03_005004 [Tulasnella sp. 419]|nr:hypothetical protein FRC03_005004 [Tulasnella sp. 419]
MLLKLIAGFVLTASNVDLKLFITGRPEHHLISVFKNPSASTIAHPFVLHDIEKSLVQQDIEAFLRYELVKVADKFDLSDPSNPWPSNDELRQLVRHCGALFIAASTAVKFLADPITGQPEEQLHALLIGGEEVATTKPYNELDKMYHYVLSNAVNSSTDPNDPHCTRFREVIGGIISVLSPLPATALGNLIGRNVRYIKAAINHLRSVIIVPSDFSSNSEPLRVFHLSFPNYLTERCSDPCFAINPTINHLQLAVHCLNTLNSFLCKNVSKLSNPLALNNDMPDLEEQVNKVVHAHHQYACKNWAFHLEASSQVPSTGDGDPIVQLKEEAIVALAKFCDDKLIMWLEALVLLGCLDKSIPALKAAEKWLKTNRPSHSSFQLLDDTKRLVQRFYNKMRLGGSQVYNSGLAFAPDCTLYEKSKSILDIKVLKGRAAGWDPCLSILREHNGAVLSAAFSHDSTMIVSGSYDKTVCIWDAVTGSLIRKLEGHIGWVYSVAFSHDSTMIISGSYDETVCIWDAVTGYLIRKLEGHNGGVNSVAFSHDSTMIVSGSDDKTVCIWDAVTGSLIRKLEGHSGSVWSVAFSYDSTIIVSGSSDKTVCIWDADTGSLIRKLEGHNDPVWSVAFSHDSTMIVSGSSDKTVCIWDAVNGSLIRKLEGHNGPVCSVAFSHDSTMIVSGSDDNTVGMWDAVTGSLIRKLEGHNGTVWPVAFSHDSTMIVSGSSDRTVCIWDAVTGSLIRKLKGHNGGVKSVAFSHDSTMIVSASSDKTLCIWDAVTCSLIRKLGHHDYVKSVAFSADGLYVVAYNYGGVNYMWSIADPSKPPVQAPQLFPGHQAMTSSYILSIESNQIIHITPNGQETLLCYLPDELGRYITCVMQSGAKLTFGTRYGDLYILDFASLINTYFT